MIRDMVRTELKRHKLRTGLTITGVVIGIFLITTMASFSEGVQITVDNELGYIAGKVTILEEGFGYANFQQSELDESLVAELEALSGVKQVAPFISTIAPGIDSIGGFSFENADMFESSAIGFESGSEYEDDTNEVVLGNTFAENNDYVVGDVIRIRLVDYEIVGIFKKTGTRDDLGVFTSIETAQKIAGLGDKVTIIMVQPNNVGDAEKLAEEIMSEFDEVTAATEKDAQRSAAEFTGQLNIMIYAVGGIASIIAGIVIMNVMLMSVRERRREIGAMKALGATDLQILLEIVGESITLTLIGWVLGVLLSFGAVYALNAIIGSTLAVITADLLMKTLAYSIVLGAIGGAIPARQAYKLNPIVALHYE